MTISGLFDQTRAIPTPVAAGHALARLKAAIDAENMPENGHASRISEQPPTEMSDNRAIIGPKPARAGRFGLIDGLPIPGSIGKSP